MKNKRSIFITIAGICLVAYLITACGVEQASETNALVETIEETTGNEIVESTDSATEENETIPEQETLAEDIVDETDEFEEEVPEGGLSSKQKEVLSIISTEIIDQLDLDEVTNNFPDPLEEPLNSVFTFKSAEDATPKFMLDCLQVFFNQTQDIDNPIVKRIEWGKFEKESTLKRLGDLFGKTITDEDIEEYNADSFGWSQIKIENDIIYWDAFASGETWWTSVDIDSYELVRINDNQVSVTFPYYVYADDYSHIGIVTVILNDNPDSFWGYNMESLTAEINSDYIILPDSETKDVEQYTNLDPNDPFYGKKIYMISTPFSSGRLYEIFDDLSERLAERGAESTWALVNQILQAKMADLISDYNPDVIVLVAPLYSNRWEELIKSWSDEGIAVFGADVFYVDGMTVSVMGTRGGDYISIDEALMDLLEQYFKGEELKKGEIKV